MAPARAPLRVGIVDDNRLIRRLLGLILENAGYVPVEADSGVAALELVRTTLPDAWLVDESMPGMSGADLIRTLRRSCEPRVSDAPIVGISGRAGAMWELLDAGADAFVPKPVEERAVLSAIARAVAAHVHGPSELPAA